MSNQIVISSGAKVRDLNGVLTGTTGVVSSVPLGAANGVATLDAGGKVPVSQLPSSVVTYLGTWNAATNTPTLVNGTGDAGDMYICNVAGTVNFGAGPITFAVGDWVLYGSGTWQKSNGQNGTVTSVAVTESGDALTITGSPITTAGTINIGFAGDNTQYINGAGNLTTFPSLAGYVPYTGATTNVDLGSNSFITNGAVSSNSLKANGLGSSAGQLLLKQAAAFSSESGYTTICGYDFAGVNGIGFISNVSSQTRFAVFDFSLITSGLRKIYTFPNSDGTIALTSNLSAYLPLAGGTLTGGLIGTTGSFASSGGSDTFTINHSSGSGIALNITKAGNGEGLYINKTSGSGNAATIVGTLNATTLVKNGGTSSQFLMADGSVNTSVLPSGAYLPLAGGTLTGALSGTSATFSGQVANSLTGQSTIGLYLNSNQPSGINWYDIDDNEQYSIGIFANSGSGYWGIWSATGSTAIDRGSTTPKFVVKNTGNVGIGIIDPLSKLHISGQSGTTGLPALLLYGEAPADGQRYGLNVSSDALDISALGANATIKFFTGGNASSITERMRITSGGNVLIGTTTDNGIKLRVNSTDNWTSEFMNTYSAGQQLFCLFSYSGSGIGSIQGNGSNVSYFSSSDYRLKEDLKDFNAIDKILSLKVYDFKWKSTGQRMDGFIAHELQEVIPYAVSGEKDGEQMQNVDYSKLTPVNTKAIQELYLLVKEQQAQINELKALIAAK